MIVFVEVPQINLMRFRKTPSDQHRRVARGGAELHASRMLENTE